MPAPFCEMPHITYRQKSGLVEEGLWPANTTMTTILLVDPWNRILPLYICTSYLTGEKEPERNNEYFV